MKKGPTVAALLSRFRTASIVEATGVSHQSVWNWRKGRMIPSAQRLPVLAEFLGIDLGELTRIVAADASNLSKSKMR